MARFWIVALGLAACGHGNQSGDPHDASTGNNPDASVTDGASSDAAQTSMMVGSGGGTLRTPDGVVLVIPPGAVSAPTPIAITIVTQDLPNGTVSHVYELSPDGTQFAEPVTLTIPYDPALLAGQPESDLALASNSSQGWKSAGWALIDTGTHSVTGYIMHFSRWAIIPSQGGQCNLNYGCFQRCCGVQPPDLCCSLNKNTCWCRAGRDFPSFVGCLADCVGAPSTSNFGNSKCMGGCCAAQAGTANHGACMIGTQTQAQAVLDCGRRCPAQGDQMSLCPSGSIQLDACAWQVTLGPPESGIGGQCNGTQGGLVGQFLYTDLNAVLAQQWQFGAMDIAGGTVSASAMTAQLSCDVGSYSGSLTASWAGTGYVGTWSFGTAGTTTGSVSIDPAWGP